MNTRKFYNLYGGGHYAVAKAADNVDPLIFPDEGWVSNWATPCFSIFQNDGIIADFTCSDIDGRLCSNSLKDIIEKNKAKNDIIQWLPVKIYNEETGDTLQYHHLHFPEPLDCLSRKHCKFNPGSERVMVPVYSYQKIKGKQIFNSSGGYETIITLFSDKMRKAIEEAECTGLDLEPANVIYDEEKARQAAS